MDLPIHDYSNRNSSVNVVCRCCLTHVSCIEVTGLMYSGYSDDVKKTTKVLSQSLPYVHVLQSTLCAGPVCSMLMASSDS